MLDRDLRDLRDLRETLRERSAPEEAQGLPPIATARSELAVFIAGVVGSALLTGLVLVLAIRAYGKRRASANRAGSSTGCLASANRQERLRGHVNSSGR